MIELSNRFQMTLQGYRKLVDELCMLENTKRPEVIDRLKTIREEGDRSQSAEFQSAEAELNAIEERIVEDKYILDRAEVVGSHVIGNKQVGLGSFVRVEMDGYNHEFTIVGAVEADPTTKKISQNSPLGKAILGKKVGQTVKFDSPTGEVAYVIKSVK